MTFPVIPAKSGIQGLSGADITPALDSGLRRNDEIELVKPSYCQMSTLPRQITVFTNRILRTFDKNIDAPIPFEREGARVEYSQSRNNSAMYQAVLYDIERIRSMDDLDNAVIAILARDTQNLARFKDFCHQRGGDGIVEIGEPHPDGPWTILGRIPDAKGLEYDAVIVMGVNDSFSGTLFNRKLLYLATTRAKHFLGIHWSGKRSPILDELSELGMTWYRR